MNSCMIFRTTVFKCSDEYESGNNSKCFDDTGIYFLTDQLVVLVSWLRTGHHNF